MSEADFGCSSKVEESSSQFRRQCSAFLVTQLSLGQKAELALYCCVQRLLVSWQKYPQTSPATQMSSAACIPCKFKDIDQQRHRLASTSKNTRCPPQLATHVQLEEVPTFQCTPTEATFPLDIDGFCETLPSSLQLGKSGSKITGQDGDAGSPGEGQFLSKPLGAPGLSNLHSGES